MNKSLIYRAPLALLAVALVVALGAATASASTGFEAEEKDSTHSTALIGESTSALVLNLDPGEFACYPEGVNATTSIPATGVLAHPQSVIECALGELKTNGCNLTFAPEGTIGISPPGCGPMVLVHSFGITCNIPSQSGLAATYTNEGSGSSRTVAVQALGEGLKYECSSGPKENGAISGSWSLGARNVAGETEGLWVSNSLSLPTLCETSGETCAAENQYPAETQLQGSSAEAAIALKFPVGTVKIKCASSFSAQPGVGVASSWTLSNCKAGQQSCTATAVDTYYYTGSLAQGAGNDGTLAFVGGSSSPGWHVTGCEDCTYTFAPTLDIKSGSPGSLVASKETMSQSGPECLGGSPTFTATYSISTPSPIYVSQG